jgi:hypothetical protein
MHMGKINMKKGSTVFLRFVIVVLALIGLAICIFGIPEVGGDVLVYFGVPTIWRYIMVIGLYGAAAAYFNALYQTMKLLGYIDRNNAFKEASVVVLKKIKYSAVTMSVLLIMFLEPIGFFIAEADDAPGMVIIAMAFCCSPIVIAVFAAVLERLLRNAIDMKAENELTV